MSNTSYDLISINGVALPDVRKGEVNVIPLPKYNEYETEGGQKVIEIIEEGMLQGNVTYSGLLQSQIQTISSLLSVVSILTIYNPHTGNVKTFQALITVDTTTKILHDANANAWAWGFSFEEIGDVVT